MSETRMFKMALTDEQLAQLVEMGLDPIPVYGEKEKERSKEYREKAKAEKEWMRDQLKKAGITPPGK